MKRLPPISEKDFSRTIEDLLRLYGWRYCHFRPARMRVKGEETYRTALTGDKGFVDIVAVRRGMVLFLELKSETGKLTEEQTEWMTDLKEVVSHSLGVMAYVFRPSDFEKAVAILK